MSIQLRPSARALSDIAAQVADGSRLARGRLYFRQGAVSISSVKACVVEGTVDGSRSQVYRVKLRCKAPTKGQVTAARAIAEELRIRGELLEDPDQVHRLVDAFAHRRTTEFFDRSGYSFSCDCPDNGDPCKHGVAMLMALANLVQDDAREFITFRGFESEDLDTTPLEERQAKEVDVDGDEEDGDGDGLPIFEADHVDAGEFDEDGDAVAPEGLAALTDFFTGEMVDGEVTLTELRSLPAVFDTVPVVVDGLDAAPVFAHAIDWINGGLA